MGSTTSPARWVPEGERGLSTHTLYDADRRSTSLGTLTTFLG